MLLEMINDLMGLSKIEARRMDMNPEPFDVKALVATCSPLVSEKADVALNYEVSEDVGRANTDQARLRRMVINLLGNAIKPTDAGSVTFNAARDGDHLVIAVADTGKGIPSDEIDTIFDEYRQVKGSDREQKGAGLGLSITKKFAELLGGSTRVVSLVGRGSTVHGAGAGGMQGGTAAPASLLMDALPHPGTGILLRAADASMIPGHHRKYDPRLDDKGRNETDEPPGKGVPDCESAACYGYEPQGNNHRYVASELLGEASPVALCHDSR